MEGIKTYKGLKKVTHSYKLKDKGEENLGAYYLNSNLLKNETVKQNEVIKNIIGMYKNSNLYIQGKKIPIYFKNKRFTPKNGKRLKIHYAHLGYYKKLQLVIYRKKDFEILE